MKALLQCTVNGQAVDDAADTRDTLLDFLRDRLGLTGTKEGCGNGNCGTCTVLLDGQPVNACLVLAHEVAGRVVTTIEGLTQRGQLDALQRAFLEHSGMQCGYCTPGLIISAKALLGRNPRPTAEEVRWAIAGNLCRCTGYDKVVRAILAAAEQGAGESA